MAKGTGTGARWAHRALLGSLTLLFSAGCGGEKEGGSGVQIATQDAQSLLKGGQVQKALGIWKQNNAANPASVEDAVGAAYAALLEGRLQDADSILAAVEPSAGAELGGIRVRRTLIALEMGDNAKVLEFGKSSGTPEGQVLAAEAALCDSDWDTAKTLFSPIAGTASPVGTTAATYVERLEQEDPVWGSLAEAEACWALGQREWSVEVIAEVFDMLPDTWDNRGEEAVVWASRALREGQPEVAETLLKKSDGLPAYQKWRLSATQALVHCAKGDVEACKRKLDAIGSEAPPLGVSHARAMGAMLLGSEHAEDALSLLGEDQTISAAYVANTLGDAGQANRHAPQSLFKKSLGAQ